MAAIKMGPAPVAKASRSAFSSGSLSLSARPVARAGRAPPARVVRTQALFGFGKPKEDVPMICIDCGYIVPSGFNDLPRSYKCPQCNVGKNRFKKAPAAAGSGYSSLAAERKAVRAAKAASSAGGGKAAAGGMSKREQMRQRQMEMQEEKDSKKKGWFGR